MRWSVTRSLTETLALIMAGGQRGRLTPLTDPLQYTGRSIRHTIPVIILD